MHNFVSFICAVFNRNFLEKKLIVFKIFRGNIIFGELVDEVNIHFYLCEASRKHDLIFDSCYSVIMGFIELVIGFVGFDIRLDIFHIL